MKRLIVLALILLPISQAHAQNQFHMTQYMVHQPFINPAAAGAKTNFNGALFYRAQYVGFDGAPRVAGLNVNSPIGKGNSNIGLSVVNDQIGVNDVTDISLNYAYTLRFANESRLSFGVSGILSLMQSDYGSVQTNGINDPFFTDNTPTLLAPNVKLGVYYQKNRFYIGLATPKLLQSDIVFTNEYAAQSRADLSQTHVFLQGGYRFTINETTELHASSLMKYAAGAPIQFDFNALVEFKEKFGIGLSGRTNGDLAAIVQYRITDMFKLSYSYDYALNRLSDFSTGSHEIMLLVDIKSALSPLKITSPRF
ncbi:MAG: type IX secretion system membrane protein PorP/SprF [Crocinitomicaceae bacterium]